MVQDQVNKVGSWSPHLDSPGSTSLLWQHEQEYCCAKGSHCISLEIVASLLKSASVTFSVSVYRIYCSLFTLQVQVFSGSHAVYQKMINIVFILNFCKQNFLSLSHDFFPLCTLMVCFRISLKRIPCGALYHLCNMYIINWVLLFASFSLKQTRHGVLYHCFQSAISRKQWVTGWPIWY